MRILFVVPYVPNLIRTRPYNLIRVLTGLGHELTVLTLASSEAEYADVAQLMSLPARVIVQPLSRMRSIASCAAAVVSKEPLQAAYCWQPALAGELRHLLESEPFDVVHVEHLRGARYALNAKSIIGERGLETTVVWDSVDCISHLFRQAADLSPRRSGRALAKFELPRTERFEGQLLSRFDAVLVTSPSDQRALCELADDKEAGLAPIHVVSNGVDLDAFRPDLQSEREPATLILSGKMSYHANVSMALYLVEQVMPRIWAARPDARVALVGKNPSREVLALGSDSRVQIAGFVPDIRPHLNTAALAVAPIVYGAGIQNKILEAMACATPVVTTPQALSSLLTTPGKHLVVGEDTEALANAIIDLLSNREMQQAIGRAGRDYVEQFHNWQLIGKQAVDIYSGTIWHKPPNLKGDKLPLSL